MYEEFFSKANAQFSELLAPARKFNGLVVDNLERLLQFQLEATKTYADLSLEQLRAALEINDAKSLQDYVAKQQKVAEALSQKISEDATTLAGLGKDFGSEVQKLAQENAGVFAQFAPTQQARKTNGKAGPVRKSA